MRRRAGIVATRSGSVRFGRVGRRRRRRHELPLVSKAAGGKGTRLFDVLLPRGLYRRGVVRLLRRGGPRSGRRSAGSPARRGGEACPRRRGGGGGGPGETAIKGQRPAGMGERIHPH